MAPPRLAEEDVQVWIIDLDAVGETLSAMSETLSPDENQRAARFKNDMDRIRYAASHWALRHILAGYFGTVPRDLQFYQEEFGKPQLHPSSNPLELSFNLAHSYSMAMVGVARGRRIGVDLEQRRNTAIQPGVAERFCSARELDALHAAGAAGRPEVFFNCWTRKEAYLKAVGCGLVDEVSSIEIAIGPQDVPRLLRGLGSPFEPEETWQMYSLQPRPGYTAAVVVEADNPLPLETFYWNQPGQRDSG